MSKHSIRDPDWAASSGSGRSKASYHASMTLDAAGLRTRKRCSKHCLAFVPTKSSSALLDPRCGTLISTLEPRFSASSSASASIPSKRIGTLIAEGACRVPRYICGSSCPRKSDSSYAAMSSQ